MRPKTLLLTTSAALILAQAAAFCSPAKLGGSIALNRLVTPNGDGRNDSFIFRCYNPRDSRVEAGIYDLSGRRVAAMRLKRRSDAPGNASASGIYYDLEWDPNSGGHKPGGVYVYQVSLETNVYKGTVTVIR